MRGHAHSRIRPLQCAVLGAGAGAGACSGHAPFVRLHQSPRVYMGLLGAGLWLRPRPLRVGRGRLLPLWGHCGRGRGMGERCWAPNRPHCPKIPQISLELPQNER